MSTIDKLHHELDKRGIKWFMNQNGITIFTSPVLGRVLVWESVLGEGLILDVGYVSKTLEQVIEATLGAVPYSKPTTLSQLKDENGKLRELAGLLLYGMHHEAPPHEVLLWSQKVNRLMDELGIEVDE